MSVPAGRWDQGVQGNLGHLHLPSVQTYPADLWDQALRHLPGQKIVLFIYFVIFLNYCCLSIIKQMVNNVCTLSIHINNSVVL